MRKVVFMMPRKKPMGARTVARASPPEGGTGVRKGWGVGECCSSGGLLKCREPECQFLDP